MTRRRLIFAIFFSAGIWGQEPKPVEGWRPDVAPKLIRKTRPQYTKKALKDKVEGTVILLVIVEPTGLADEVKVVQSIGYGLDESAIKCVRQWKFAPATKDKKPVRCAATVEINFKLGDGAE